MYDECVKKEALAHFETMDASVLQALINNREGFLALMAKIKAEIGDGLLKVEIVSGDDPEFDPETHELVEADEATALNVAFINQMLLANYVVSFFNQELPGAAATQVGPMVNHMIISGRDDGHAYATYRKIRPN